MKCTIPGKYTGFGEAKYPKLNISSRYVPGYDGTRLAVDIVRPADEDGKPIDKPFPVIMLISRNGRFEPGSTTGSDVIEYCVPHGYVGVIPEMRGCGASYGIDDSFTSIENRKDVNALLDWCGEQDWCDGTAGTFGGSNRGLIQFAAAVTKPAPSKVLKSICPVVANPDFYYQDYPNGVSACPAGGVEPGKTPEESARKFPRFLTKEEFLEKVKPVDEDVNGDMAYEAFVKDQYKNDKVFYKWLLLPNMLRDDPNVNLGGELTNLTIPPVTDLAVFPKTGIKVHQFAGLLESGAFGQLMAAKEWNGSIILGPWDHFQSRRGNPDVPEGKYDFLAEHLKWFDYSLKGVKNGFGERPAYVYYVQNAPDGEHWRVSDTWPVENARPVVMYLSSERAGQIDSVNDGTLTRTLPSEAATDYTVDTKISVFDNGNGKGATINRMHLTWDGDMTEGVDKKSLTFTSSPLFFMYKNELVGSTTVDLWVSCTQPDADFIAYLEEVREDGTSHFISSGCIRASHRKTEPREAWNACGAYYHPSMRADVDAALAEGMAEPVHLQFAIEPAAYRFAKNSRLRITINCADTHTYQHPMYAEDNLPTITLYQGGDKASFVKLPFIEHTENVYNGTVRKNGNEGPGTLYFFKKAVYLYADGVFEKYSGDGLTWEIRNGIAEFNAGFSFRMEGRPICDGILQEYLGGDPVIIPFPAKRYQVVDVLPVDDDKDRLFVPDVKTLYVEEFAENNTAGQEPVPVILYMHGYGRTPSYLDEQPQYLIRNGYTVVGIDMRNYPPNAFPDYMQDSKGCVRYIRANAKRFGIDPDRIGASGQSLGGNGALQLASMGSCSPDLEGTVGGNLEYSSRIQAVNAGYAWCDLFTMGPDIVAEYEGQDEALVKRKFANTDGEFAPAAAVVGFTGKGRGLKNLREYREKKRAGLPTPEGDAEAFEKALKDAENASPLYHIGPDMPPTSLFSGLGYYSIDIACKQSLRTFQMLQKYNVDCDLFLNTNGNYGRKIEIMDGIVRFFDRCLKHGPVFHKTVLVPGSKNLVENEKNISAKYSPVIRKNGKLYIAVPYAKEHFGAELSVELVSEGVDYASADAAALAGTGIGVMYYPDKDMAVILPEEMLPQKKPEIRA